MTNKFDDRFVIPIRIVNDCISRFLMAEGDKVLRDRIHFCTYLEQAYWFYTDCWVDEEPDTLIAVSFQCFVEQACRVTDIPVPGGGSVAALCSEFLEFKHKVSTYGAILINPQLNKVLLVQSFNGQSWGFPKGKIEKRECYPECAVREVKEEIDYDITPFLNPNCYIEANILEQRTRLYIIYGVPEDTPFKTNTRKEIKAIRWFDIDHLPLHKRDKKALKGLNFTPNNFFLVIPFVKPLREHVQVMMRRCLGLFKVAYFSQKDHHYKFLKSFYPDIYKIRIDDDEEKRKIALRNLEAQQAECSSGLEKVYSKGLTNKVTEPNIMEMLQSAISRGQSQSQSVYDNNAISSSGSSLLFYNQSTADSTLPQSSVSMSSHSNMNQQMPRNENNKQTESSHQQSINEDNIVKSQAWADFTTFDFSSALALVKNTWKKNVYPKKFLLQ